MLKRNTIENFLDKIDKTQTCWIWKGTRNGKYGQYVENQKRYRAHKYAYLYFKGDVPAGFYVCHTCDNPLCVNPEHLFLGTPKDNMQDCVRKQRNARGESGNNKLTTTDVLLLRALWENKLASLRQLSRIFNIALWSVWLIISRQRWSHV